jgi:glyoxylase-like metal-dependent hydrolase (beta-lactamase superfamily II)
VKTHGLFFVPIQKSPLAKCLKRIERNREMQVYAAEPIKLSEHLYQLGTKRFPVYLSLGERGMIIEGGTGGTAELIAAQVAQLGVDPARIDYLALTHTHADHIGAMPRLRELWPSLRILAGPVAAAALSAANHINEFRPADRMIGKILLNDGVIEDMPPVAPENAFQVDAVLEEGARIDLGHGVVWHVLLTPGHSPCHVSYFEQKESVLAMGDMAGYLDQDLDVIWPNYFHSLEDYCLSIQKVAILPAKTAVLSHNGAVDLGKRPFLRQALEAAMEYHFRLLERMAGGESKEEICREQARWVYSYAPIASPKAIEFLCGLLCRNSRKAALQTPGESLGWTHQYANDQPDQGSPMAIGA